mmetsp:Transcript_2762/g.6153  ORF Transcript_2762/g.6153 Transcript_2762/m.6153 type:complete len:99 (+) Transcript_2762:2041-2337(+)
MAGNKLDENHDSNNFNLVRVLRKSQWTGGCHRGYSEGDKSGEVDDGVQLLISSNIVVEKEYRGDGDDTADEASSTRKRVFTSTLSICAGSGIGVTSPS